MPFHLAVVWTILHEHFLHSAFLPLLLLFLFIVSEYIAHVYSPDRRGYNILMNARMGYSKEAIMESLFLGALCAITSPDPPVLMNEECISNEGPFNAYQFGIIYSGCC